MKLQQLRYFQEVAMRNSVTKAANALYVSQPTVSNAIRDLEEEYGLKLFTRSAGKLTLTKEGGYLLLSAQELLQQVGQIEATLRDFGSKETVIRLGITPMIGPMAIDMVRDFLAEYPDYKIELSDSPSMRSRQMLNREMLDVLVVSGFNTDFENCGNYQLRSRELQLCVRKDDPLAGRTSISLEEAAAHPLVLFTEDYYVRHKLIKRFREVKAEPENYVELYQLSTHFHMIREHGYGGFFFTETIEKQPDMVGISLEPPMNINVEIVWRKNSWQYHGVRKFIEYARDYAKEKPLAV